MSLASPRWLRLGRTPGLHITVFRRIHRAAAKPAVANRAWNKVTGQYESDEQFIRRIDDDVHQISRKIEQVSGKAPRAWVWPYGAANGTSLGVLKKQGYQMAFTLNDGLADARDLDNIPRVLISGNPTLKTFASIVSRVREPDPVRVMHVDLDYVYDPNPVQQAKNIDALVQRVYDMKISHVFLPGVLGPARRRQYQIALFSQPLAADARRPV